MVLRSDQESFVIHQLNGKRDELKPITASKEVDDNIPDMCAAFLLHGSDLVEPSSTDKMQWTGAVAAAALQALAKLPGQAPELAELMRRRSKHRRGGSSPTNTPTSRKCSHSSRRCRSSRRSSRRLVRTSGLISTVSSVRLRVTTCIRAKNCSTKDLVAFEPVEYVHVRDTFDDSSVCM